MTDDDPDDDGFTLPEVLLAALLSEMIADGWGFSYRPDTSLGGGLPGWLFEKWTSTRSVVFGHDLKDVFAAAGKARSRYAEYVAASGFGGG